jgi:TetR/AcrR family transcriptional regulator, cholesterol catabolism regulator
MAESDPSTNLKRESAIGRRRRAAQEAGSEEYVAKRQEVIRAAATVFQEKGFDTATLHDVAAALDTDRATLYYYIAGKDDLLREIVQEHVLKITVEAREIAAAESSAAAKLARFLPTLMASFEAYFPYIFVFIQEDGGENKRRTQWGRQLATAVNDVQTQIVQIVENGIRDGEFRKDVPAELVTNALFGMVNWSHRWFTPGGPHSGEEIGNYFATLLLKGLVKTPDSASGPAAQPDR